MESESPTSSLAAPPHASADTDPAGFGHRLRHPSLRSKLWAGLGGVMVILLTVSALSVVVLTHYSHTLERIFRENYDSVTYCEAMKTSLDGLNAEAQKLVFNEGHPEKNVTDGLMETFTRNAEHQRSNSVLPGERKKSDAVALDWQKYRAEHAHLVDVPADGRRAFYRDTLLPENHALRLAIEEISAMNLSNMTAVDGRVRTTVATVQNTLIILAIVGSTIAGLAVFAIGPAVLRPLSALTRSAQEIADGRLDLSVPIRTEDEVGQLAKAFNVMAARLRAARERDQDRLVRTQQTTQRAIDSLPDAVVVVNPDGGIELANRAALERFALSAEGGAMIPRFLAPLHEEVLKHGRASTPSGYRSAIQKFWDGEEHFFLPRAVPLIDETGRTVGVTIVLADVTRLKEADAAKSDLVSTVSHELRTPLTSIRMAVHMMVDGTFGEPSKQHAELLQTARDNADRLHRILENLLSISRMESGRAPLVLERMPVSQIIEASVGPLRESFAGANVNLKLPDQQSGALSALADPSCIGHVLTNLLTNALRHTPPGGAVSVECEPSVTATDQVRFSVSDTGQGIAEENLPHLFEKFFRVAASPSKPAGAGLGLAIAKEIVEAHGGAIWVDSPRGRGASFSFTLVRIDNGPKSIEPHTTR